MNQYDRELLKLLRSIERAEWGYEFIDPPDVPICTRLEMQAKEIPKDNPWGYGRSSGSTGTPVVVPKNTQTILWHQAATIRELSWRGWDISKVSAGITPKVKKYHEYDCWGRNFNILGEQGKIYVHPSTGDFQGFLEKVNPYFISTFPSIEKIIDRSRLPNLVDIKSTSEMGATSYSCEEAGIIGLTCPDNPDVYHIMENIVLEIIDGQIIITDLVNPFVQRYATGDYGEFVECTCSRGLKAINKKVLGRKRNFVTYHDGSKNFPILGNWFYRDIAPITRYQVVQETLDQITLKIICRPTNEKEKSALADMLREALNYNFLIKVEHVDEFPPGKFEEFKSLIGEN